MIKFVATAVVVLALGSSCSTAQIEALDKAGGVGVLTNQMDQFDGMRRIKLTPAWVSKTGDAGGFNWTALKVGAQWQGKAPENITISAELPGEIQSVSGIGFNVEGDIRKYLTLGPTQFESNTGNRWIPVESTAYFSVPLEEFASFVESDDVQLRLYMPGGEYMDADFGDLAGTGGAPTARHYLRGKFLPEVLAAVANLPTD